MYQLMSSIAIVFLSMAILCAGQSVRDAGASSVRVHIQVSSDPAVEQFLNPGVKMARLRGKKLIVTGVNFDLDAVILVDGKAVKTRTDPNYPGTRLIAKKGAKGIDQFFEVAVRNSDGEDSVSVRYYKTDLFIARILSNTDVFLELDEYLLMKNVDDLQVLIPAPNVLRRVLDVAPPSSEYWLYQAFQTGVSRFYALVHDGRSEVPPLIFYDAIIRVD